MHKFANPARFNRLADKIIPWSTGVMALGFAYGLYLAFFASPADYQQGEMVRIMYIHVPAAMMAMGAYTSIAIASFVAMVWKHPLAALAGKAIAPIGAGFTALALITGMVWGQPMWGAWWDWSDARLTSFLILFFLYLGYMAIWQTVEDFDKASKAAAILAIVGAINIPIIKYSVSWWNTLHQPASKMIGENANIASGMQAPLFVMIIAFSAYFTTVTLWRMKLEIDRRKIAAMRNMRASSAQENRA